MSAARVLVVEDDPDIAALLTRRLTRLGHAVEAVGTGSAALAAATRAVPDLVLLDILLPDTDGWTVLRELRARPGLAEVPVVVVSILDAPDDADARPGISGHLTKPFRTTELDRAVAPFLSPTPDETPP